MAIGLIMLPLAHQAGAGNDAVLPLNVVTSRSKNTSFAACVGGRRPHRRVRREIDHGARSYLGFGDSPATTSLFV